jgi:hypothetical protein
MLPPQLPRYGEPRDRDQAVQRKVGFEFQAYDSVTYRKGERLGWLGDQITVGKGRGFEVQNDHGKTADEMEIVTEAVEETFLGRKALVKQMGKISSLALGIRHLHAVNALKAGGVRWEPIIDEYNFHAPGGVHFHPQSTVGVKFSKLGELLGHLVDAPAMTGGVPVGEVEEAPGGSKEEIAAGAIGWSGKLDQQAFKVAWQRGLAEAREDFREYSSNLIGFASLLYGFAAVTQDKVVPEDASQPKYFMPFLLRLGLRPHFGTLTPEEKEALGERMRPSVRESEMLPLEGKRVPKVSEMLGLLGEGSDLHQNLETIPLGYAASKPKTLGMKNEADIGSGYGLSERKRQGAIIELRKLGNDVPPGQLTDFALAVFDLVRLVHGSGK